MRTYKIRYSYEVEITAESMEEATGLFSKYVPHTPEQVDDKNVYFEEDIDNLIDSVFEDDIDITDDFKDEFDKQWI